MIECEGIDELSRVEKKVKSLVKLPSHPNLISHINYYIQNSATKDVFQSRLSRHASRGSGKIYANFLTFQEEKNQYFICVEMEFCNSGTLESVIRHVAFSQKYVLVWMKQICQGLDKLHSHNIVHRDIKPANIFFHDTLINNDTPMTSAWKETKNDQFVLKIGDFGLLKMLESKLAQTKVGTIYFMSPEMLSDVGHDTSSDIWSFGLILLLLLVTMKNRKLNYETNQELLRKMRRSLIANNGVQNLSLRLKLYKEFIVMYNPKICSVMFECLNHNPEQRPTAKEIVLFTLNNKKFLRVDPLKIDTNSTNWEDGFFTNYRAQRTPSRLNTSHLKALKDPKVKAFWQSFFGDNLFKVDWRTFSGAYQSRYRRLGTPKCRGLKKILCGPNSSVVTIYHLSDCVKRIGFPFSTRVLEKVEKFAIGQTENEVLDNRELYRDVEIKTSPVMSERGQLMFHSLMTQYEQFYRDPVIGKYIDITKECVPILPLEPFLSGLGHRIVIYGKPFTGKSVFLKHLQYHFVKQNRKLTPVIIDVAKLSENYDKLQQFFPQCIRALYLFRYCAEIESFLMDQFKRKELVLLFDGVHEIYSPELRELIYEEIFKLSEAYFSEGKSGIILTSRIVNPKFEQHGFDVINIPLLNEEQQLQISEFNSLDVSFKTEVLDHYSNSLCKVPLFLKMTIELFKKKTGKKQWANDPEGEMMAVQREKLDFKNIYTYSTTVTANIIERILDLWIMKWENLVFQKQQIVKFMTALCRYLMNNRIVEFSEDMFSEDKHLVANKHHFMHLKEYIRSGFFDFISFDIKKDMYHFTYVEFQYYFPTITVLNEVNYESVVYDMEKQKKVFKILRKRKYLETVYNYGTKFLDPWYSQMIDHVYLQLAPLTFKNFAKSIFRIKGIQNFCGVSLIVSCMAKRSAPHTDEEYISLISYLRKNMPKGCRNTLFYGMSHKNPEVRGLSRSLCMLYRNNGLVVFEDYITFIRTNKNYDADYFGSSLYEVLNLKQKKNLIVKLIGLSKKSNKQALIKYVKILKFLKTQDKVLHNEIVKIISKIVNSRKEELKKQIIYDCCIIVLKMNNMISNEGDFVNAGKFFKHQEVDFNVLFNLFKTDDPNEKRKTLEKAQEIVRVLIHDNKEDDDKEENDEAAKRKSKRMSDYFPPVHLSEEMVELIRVGRFNQYFDKICENDTILVEGIEFLIQNEKFLEEKVKGKTFVFCRNIFKREQMTETISRAVYKLLPKVVSRRFCQGTIELLLSRVQDEKTIKFQKKAVTKLVEILMEHEKYDYTFEPCGIAVSFLIDFYMNSIDMKRKNLAFKNILRITMRYKKFSFAWIKNEQITKLIKMGTFEAQYIVVSLMLMGNKFDTGFTTT